ncbi:carbohydrate ABC transporter permease [Rhodopseudomonas palustris]|uniref:Carbohydrate ABC transporter permease n=1 Tax=Rhodopseudomonas palustris (strain ATCC BAA-98 / CGA009) TaxID=258594 RepID=Q6N9Y9_RHOPA|nr:carbohydrate ABC transporter permease [Rhodopseudomonas palustris]OPF91360.1 sugar ABC transporter permease [Rhodopseudomonas palustris]PPQ43806.1 carbohydrate ABC transporter permease [Rhodopseudomonas palustris]QQM02894.1 Diacetylchitobiose uptake system permease protein DasC [Rhodopseudomonas palustris]RJF60477.1 carbohydrate ABC transporter permease [Rhodopseudomonas palustris]WAB79068.1 carbohydrate ABC transporter permease [Rhodopseudomonas palustris]
MADRPLPWSLLVVLLGAIFVTLFPIFWIVMTAIKPPTDWNAVPAIWIPSEPTLVNFRTLFNPEAIREYGVGGVSQAATMSVLGSILSSTTATLLSVTIGLLSAIGISRYSSGGRATPLMILSGRMFPPAAIAVPFVIIFSSIGLIDTYSGLIAIYVAATLPFSTWMLKSFVDEIPREIEEAAMVDGKSRLMAHLTVTLPLIRGGLFATTLFIFILNWSEFLFALVLSYTNIETIPVRLAKYVTATAGTLYGVQAALAVLAMAPLVIAGFLIQNHLARGMTFGAIKR